MGDSPIHAVSGNPEPGPLGSLAANSLPDLRIQLALSADGPVLRWLKEAFPGVMAVYAFGSQVQGAAIQGSDLDLAILMEGYADSQRIWEASSTLAERVGCEVDLVDLRLASTVMQYQILVKGIRLWAKEPDAALFEAYVCGEKLSLDEARSALIADVVQEGSVYAR